MNGPLSILNKSMCFLLTLESGVMKQNSDGSYVMASLRYNLQGKKFTV